jgi:regulator of replication initiation timing
MEAENYNYAGDCFPVGEWIALNSKKDAIEKTIEVLKEKLKEIKNKLADHVEKNHLDPVELKKLAK